MSERLLYLLAVVAAGWLVTFGLRALPFLLFAGRDRALPPWVEKLGNIVSPVIIAALIIYSYATLSVGEGAAATPAWKSIDPYLAGILTVGLHLWKRNPLVSIIAGTALYMTLLACGCTTERTMAPDAQHPALRITVQGVLFDDRYVNPVDVPELLEDRGVPKDTAIHIQLDPEVKNLMVPSFLMATLSKAGYRQPILVTKRHSESIAVGKPKKSVKKSASVAPSSQQKKKIRYKKSSE